MQQSLLAAQSIAQDNSIVGGQLFYLGITGAMTVWVARTLHANGRAFLSDAFQGNDVLATSVNKLLVVGFCLLNIGFVCVQVSDGKGLEGLPSIIKGYSQNIGWAMMVLGVMHMINLYIFNRFRKANMRHQPGSGPYRAPVAPNFVLPGDHAALAAVPAQVPAR
jgi:hypothetical protein